MSSPLEASYTNVTCPKCGSTSLFEGWPIIPNVFLLDVADDLMKGTLFEFECEACGHEDLAPYRCLYHDIPNAMLVLLEPNPDLREEAIQILRKKLHDDGSTSNLDVPKHQGRLVFHPDRLSEKARILHAGLDDCAIELMKASMHERLIGDDPLFETIKIYFSHLEDDLLYFHVSGYQDGSIAALHALYDEFVISLMVEPPVIKDYVVDESWAFEHFARALPNHPCDM